MEPALCKLYSHNAKNLKHKINFTNILNCGILFLPESALQGVVRCHLAGSQPTNRGAIFKVIKMRTLSSKFITGKVCQDCGERKPLAEFKGGSTKTGWYLSFCRQCRINRRLKLIMPLLD